MPTEIFDEESFIKLSESAIECRVRRSGEVVKMKLRTPRTLYTMKVEGPRAEEIIKRLACEVVEV
ncbi:MAG: 5'-nucleotidase [Candidatus Bathyarchaeia archaeon]